MGNQLCVRCGEYCAACMLLCTDLCTFGWTEIVWDFKLFHARLYLHGLWGYGGYVHLPRKAAFYGWMQGGISIGLFDYRSWIRIHSESRFRFTWQIEWLRRVYSTQLNEHLWTQVLKHLNVHIYVVTIAYRYYNQLISRFDLSPIPVRSAAKSYITSWCIQNLSKRVLNRQTVSTSATKLGRLFQILTRMWANAQPDGRPAEHTYLYLYL